MLSNDKQVSQGLHPLQLLAIATGSKEGVFRAKKDGAAAPRLLARIEQLKLLSRLEELKLLSLLQASCAAIPLF